MDTKLLYEAHRELRKRAESSEAAYDKAKAAFKDVHITSADIDGYLDVVDKYGRAVSAYTYNAGLEEGFKFCLELVEMIVASEED